MRHFVSYGVRNMAMRNGMVIRNIMVPIRVEGALRMTNLSTAGRSIHTGSDLTVEVCPSLSHLRYITGLLVTTS